MVHSRAYEFMSKINVVVFDGGDSTWDLWIRHCIQQLWCKYCPVIFIANWNRVMLINFPYLYISLTDVSPLDGE